jgi:glycogen phosphorylase
MVQATLWRSEGGDRDKQHVFEVEIYLSDLDPKAVRASTGYVYSRSVSAVRRPARVIPHCDGVAVPLENPLILWQR